MCLIEKVDWNCKKIKRYESLSGKDQKQNIMLKAMDSIISVTDQCNLAFRAKDSRY